MPPGRAIGLWAEATCRSLGVRLPTLAWGTGVAVRGRKVQAFVWSRTLSPQGLFSDAGRPRSLASLRRLSRHALTMAQVSLPFHLRAPTHR